MSALTSIIIPFYNPPIHKFKRCVESVLNQSCQDFELILVDDGSREEYRSLIEPYAKHNKRIKLIQQCNKGVSSARNHGMRHAAGDYICFVDADDYLDKEYLQILKSRLEGKNDLAICGICEQDFPVCDDQVKKEAFFSMPSRFIGLQYVNFSVNKLYRRSIIKENNLLFTEDMKQGEDAIFLCSYLDKCNVISLASCPLYHYVPNDQSAVHSFDISFWKWERRVIQLQWTLFHKKSLSTDEELYMQEWLYDKLIRVLRYYAEQADYKLYVCIAREIFHDPLFKELKLIRKRWAKRLVLKTKRVWIIYKLLMRRK